VNTLLIEESNLFCRSQYTQFTEWERSFLAALVKN